MLLQEQLNKWFEQSPLDFFVPTGKQQECIKEIALGNNFITILSAANGIGKTTLLANILGNCIFPSDNPYFNYPFFKSYPFIKSARIISTPKEVEEIGSIQKEIKNWWPKGQYTASKNGKQHDCLYTADDWTVDIMTYEQDLEQFEGANLSSILFNEPPPLKILYACIARLRRGGKILIFMTPLDTGGLIIEELLDKEKDITAGKDIGKIGIIYADIESACIEHGIRGYLEHKNIEQMVAFYDPEEKAARAEGKPLHLAGRIYKMFNPDIHVIPFEIAPQKNVQLYHILDPHDRKPWAMKWIIIHNTQTAYCIDEYPNRDFNEMFSDNKTYDEYVDIIHQKEDALFDIYGVSVHKRIIDPNFGNKTVQLAERVDDKAHTTPKEELAKRGLKFKDGIDHIPSGHLKVREMLRYEKKDGEIILQPRYFITDNCINSIKHLFRYSYKKDDTMKDESAVEEKYKDFCDLDRYFWMSAPVYRQGLKEFIPNRQKVY